MLIVALQAMATQNRRDAKGTRADGNAGTGLGEDVCCTVGLGIYCRANLRAFVLYRHQAERKSCTPGRWRCFTNS